MNSMTLHTRGLLAAATLAAVTAASAQTLPPPQNVVSLAASATVEVPKDWLTVVFSTTREGADAGVVQSQLKQALDAALAEARKVAKPGQVEVQTGGFSPRRATRPRAPASPAGRAAPNWWWKAATAPPSPSSPGACRR